MRSSKRSSGSLALGRKETPFANVMAWPPFGDLKPRRTWTLPLDRIFPTIHLAHHRPFQAALPPRIIYDFEFVLMMKGSGHLLLGDERIEYGPHHLLLLPPFVVHSLNPHDREEGENMAWGEHMAVHFDWAPDVPSRATSDRGPYAVRLSDGILFPRVLKLFAGHPVERYFDTLVKTWTSGEALGRFQANVALLQIVDWLLRFATSSTSHQNTTLLSSRQRMDRTISYVRDHINRPMNAEELAGVAGLSNRRLTDLFRSMTGYPPLEYVRRLRVEHAKSLLADVDISIKEIAMKTGFEDQFHFSRVFHRIVGLSPTQYRHTALGGQQQSDRP